MEEIVTFKVLWVDDEPQSILSDASITFPQPEVIGDSGIMYNIEAEIVTCWEDAEKELSKSNDFIALILDGNCNVGKENDPKISKFIFAVQDRLRKIGSQLYCFYYSGQGIETDLKNLPKNIDDPDYEWKEEHNQNFYSKPLHINDLKTNIIKYGISLTARRIKYELYQDLFRRIHLLDLHSEVEKFMVDLLEPIHFGKIKNQDYLARAVYIRLCIEHLFRSMYKNGMLPRSCVNSNEREKVNINGSFSHIKKYFIPPVLMEVVSGNGTFINKYLHTKPNRSEHIISYSSDTNSIYLVRSLTFWLCDLIMWYSHHMDTHSVHQNIKEWEKDIANPDGYEGILHWNQSNHIWEVEFQRRLFRLDNKEPDFDVESSYTNGQKCFFFLKTAGHFEFACAIKLIND